jgi:hypothetical protein
MKSLFTNLLERSAVDEGEKNIKYKEILGKKVPFSNIYEHDVEKWPEEREYRLQQAMDQFYFDCFFMLRMNRVAGDYLEFGSGSNVRSMRLALKYNRLEPFNITRKLFAFDSFEGLPNPKGVDRHPQWRKGAMAVSIEQFREILEHYSARDGEDYQTVKGFYETSIVGRDPSELGVEQAAFVHIDCDLYESTIHALAYVEDVLADGAVLSFDDWFCFGGDPDKGEQLAFGEWCERNREKFEFLPYAKFGWHGMSFLTKRLDRS